MTQIEKTEHFFCYYKLNKVNLCAKRIIFFMILKGLFYLHTNIKGTYNMIKSKLDNPTLNYMSVVQY